MANPIGALRVLLSANSAQFERDMGRARRTSDRTAGQFRANLRKMVGSDPLRALRSNVMAFTRILAPLASGVAFQKAFQASSEFGKGMALVGTLSDEAYRAQKRLAVQVRKTAKESGEDLNILAKATFDLVSATGQVEGATKGLDAAWKLAVAGGTDVGIAMDGATTIMGAYSKSVEDAHEISNALFKAQQFGKTTVGDLASNLGQVAPSARQARVELEELMASLGVTTRVLKTDIAATSVSRFFDAVANSSEEVRRKSRAMAREVGVVDFEFSSASLRANGFAQFMQKLGKVVGDDSRKLQALGVESRAAKAAIVLMANDARDLTEALKLQTNGVDELTKGVSRMSATTAAKTAKMKAAWNDLWVSFGDDLANAFHFFESGEAMDALTLFSEEFAMAVGAMDANDLARPTWKQYNRMIEDRARDAERLLAVTKAVQEAEAQFAETGKGGDYRLRQAREALDAAGSGRDVNTEALTRAERLLEDRKRRREAVEARAEAARMAREAARTAPTLEVDEAARESAREANADRLADERDALHDLANMRRDAAHDLRKSGLDALGQELVDLDRHQAELLERWEGNEFAMGKVRETFADLRLAALKRADGAEIEETKRWAENVAEIAGDAEFQLAQVRRTAREAELAEVSRQFDVMAAEARAAGRETVEIERARVASLAVVRERHLQADRESLDIRRAHEFELSMIGRSGVEAEIAREKFRWDQIIAEAKRRGAETVDLEAARQAALEAIRKEHEIEPRSRPFGREIAEAETFGKGVEVAMSRAAANVMRVGELGAESFDMLVGGAERLFAAGVTGAEDMGDVVDQLLQQFAQLAASAAFNFLLSAGFAALGVPVPPQAIGAGLAAATGSSSSPQKSAAVNSGVLTSVAKAAKSATASGEVAGGRGLTVNVFDRVGVDVESTRTAGPFGDQLEVIIDRAVAKSIEANGETSKALQRRFGLRRRTRRT